tara:strand:- start:365 stop:943 length:579 start_codon:yes stop_codon:yes gene_type:complete
MKILDDFLPIKKSQHIENILTHSNFPWFLSEVRGQTTTDRDIKKLKKIKFKNINLIKESTQFCHIFYRYDEYERNLKHSSQHVLIDTILDKLKTNNKIIRAKANYLPQSYSFNKKNFNTPHIDFEEINHKVILYYVNDSDGDTFFFNKKGNIIKKIKPKKNRCIIFDGDVFHASSNPIKSKDRIVINIDLEK